MRPFILPTTVALLLVGFLIGLLMTLFGPEGGKFVGVVAFLSLWIIGVVSIGRRLKRRPLRELRPSLERYRRPIVAAAIVCLLITMLSMAVMIFGSQGGVADGGFPVYAERPLYRFRNHGVTWNVTRTRYLVVGTAFFTAWHALPTCIGLVILYDMLYGIRR